MTGRVAGSLPSRQLDGAASNTASAAVRQAGRDQIFDHLLLAVDGDRLARSRRRSRCGGVRRSNCRFTPVVDQAFAVQPVREAKPIEQRTVPCSSTPAAPAAPRSPGSGLEYHRLDTGSVEQVGEHRPAGPAPMMPTRVSDRACRGLGPGSPPAITAPGSWRRAVDGRPGPARCPHGGQGPPMSSWAARARSIQRWWRRGSRPGPAARRSAAGPAPSRPPDARARAAGEASARDRPAARLVDRGAGGGLVASDRATASTTRSARRTPPVAARLAAMAAGVTSRPADHVAGTGWPLPRPAASSSDKDCHSACHAPTPARARPRAPKQDRQQGVGPAGSGHRPPPRRRIALVRQRGRSAGADVRRLAHFGLRQQHHVACDLGGRAATTPERAGQAAPSAGGRCARAAAVRPESEPAGKRGEDGRAVLSERRQRAGGARRAARPARPGRPELVRASSTPASQPAAFRPKVIGRACCRRVRPAISVSRWARARPAQPSARPGQFGVDRARRPLGDQHGRSIQDVLAGRAPMHP